MARDPSTEARSTPAALTVMLSIRQRSEQQHPRSHPQLDPLPVKRDAATSIERACAAAKAWSAPALLPGRTLKHSLGSGKPLHFASFLGEQQPDRPQNVRALRGSRGGRVGSGACAHGTSLMYSGGAIPTKLFPRRSDIVFTLHWQPRLCVHCMRACMGG